MSKPSGVQISLTERLGCYEDLQIPLLLPYFKEMQLDDVKNGMQIWIDELKNIKPESLENIPTKIVSLRYLLNKLRRETLDITDKSEIVDYLRTINLNEECSSEIANIVMNKKLFDGIPKSLHIHPTIASLTCRIDYTLCDESSDFRQRVRVLLLMKLTDGQKCALFVSSAGITKLLAICSAAQRHMELLELSVDNYDEELRLKHETS